MATVTFENGQSVDFQGTPTQADIEEVASKFKMQPQQPSTPAPHKNNMLQGIAVNLVGKPAIRTAQAIGGGIVNLFGNEQQKQNYQREIAKPVNLPLGLGTVEPQKAIGQGGVAQIALGAGESALNIASLGTGSAVNAGIRGTVEGIGTKVLPQAVQDLAQTKIGGYLARNIPKVVANAVEGIGYNTAYNAINQKPLGENTGSAGALSVALPPVFKGIFGGLAENKILQGIANDWKVPTTIPKASYNNATEIFNKAQNQGHDISETLINNRINPQANIKGKVYDTTDTVEKMRKDTGQISSTLLRPALEHASYLTPKIPINDIVNRAITEVQTNKKITASNMESIIQAIKNEGKALEKKYSDGMSLLDLHDNKITYSQNSGYSPFNDPKINNIATKNRAVSSALQHSLEEKAPPEIGVKGFNAQLQKNYQAADYLEALHGKTAPQSTLRKTGILIGKILGAGIGDKVGGLLGGVGGYHIGGTLVTAFENMPNPIKEKVLRELQITEPKVYSLLKKYLGDAQSFKMNSLKLPAPKTSLPALGGKDIIGNPIDAAGNRIVPPQGKAQIVPAAKNPVTVNPKTGKFQASYNLGHSNNLDQIGSVTQPISNTKNSSISSTIPQKTNISNQLKAIKKKK